jgi:hypothetical protein
MYKRTMHPFFLNKEKVEMQKRQVPVASGAAYIPRASGLGLTPRFGEESIRDE